MAVFPRFIEQPTYILCYHLLLLSSTSRTYGNKWQLLLCFLLLVPDCWPRFTVSGLINWFEHHTPSEAIHWQHILPCITAVRLIAWDVGVLRECALLKACENYHSERLENGKNWHVVFSVFGFKSAKNAIISTLQKI